VNDWIGRQCVGETAEGCFQDQRAYFLLIPWFIELRVRGDVDLEFQRALVYSSVNGYYYARLLDDIGDGHSPASAPLLPLSAFFHFNFQSAYFPWFEASSPFWGFFERTWIGMADATAAGFSQDNYSESDFSAVTVQKVAAVYIPAAAVCYRYDECALAPWLEFYSRFTHFQEMLDDFCDWQQDLAAGRPSYLLCEAARRKRSRECVASYMVCEGLPWGYAKLRMFHDMARAAAVSLNSPPLNAYLDHRLEQFEDFWRSIRDGLGPLSRLASVLEEGSNGLGSDRNIPQPE
jgi:hypothetical protein